VNKLTGNIDLVFYNRTNKPVTLEITDNAYKALPVKKVLNPAIKSSERKHVTINLSKQFGWYDFTIKIAGYDLFERRYTGRVETGKAGFSDPFMGRVI
jgi:phospholipase C